MAQIAADTSAGSTAESSRVRAEAPSSSDFPPALIARLRELRTEFQDLEAVLDSVGKGNSALAIYESYLQQTAADIMNLFAAIDAITLDRQDPPLSVLDTLDAIRHLHNLWEQIRASPMLATPKGEYPLQEILGYLSTLDEQIRQVVFQVGVLTIPARLNDCLKKARPGYYIPFHQVFSGELPMYEDRVKILNYLAWSPKVVKGGLVDASTGLIYRYSRKRWELFLSFLIVVIGVAAAISLVFCVSSYKIGDTNFDDYGTSRLLTYWAAVLAGIVTHVAVATAKRMRDQPGLPPVIACGDFVLVINAKYGVMLLKLLLALIGFFGLVLTTDKVHVTLPSFFLVGYSLDSVIELFSAGLEQRASAQIAGFKQQIGVT